MLAVVRGAVADLFAVLATTDDESIAGQDAEVVVEIFAVGAGGAAVVFAIGLAEIELLFVREAGEVGTEALLMAVFTATNACRLGRWRRGRSEDGCSRLSQQRSTGPGRVRPRETFASTCC